MQPGVDPSEWKKPGGKPQMGYRLVNNGIISSVDVLQQKELKQSSSAQSIECTIKESICVTTVEQKSAAGTAGDHDNTYLIMIQLSMKPTMSLNLLITVVTKRLLRCKISAGLILDQKFHTTAAVRTI